MPQPVPWGFNRNTVVDQAATALRSAILRGELRDPLPGGHLLARQLGISRPSVSAALNRLANDGLIAIAQGQRMRLLPRQKRDSPAPPAVCVLFPSEGASLFYAEHPLLLEMHAEFASRGVRWEAVLGTRMSSERPEARLRQLVASRPHVCWILFSVPETVQRWFAASGLPVMVLGSSPRTLKLPSVDLNYESVGWHAAGTLIRHGHKRIALILPAEPLAGDGACRAGFHRYLRQQTENVSVIEWHAPDRPERCRAKFAELLSAEQRPTALFSMRPALTIALIVQVMESGFRVPQDVSIISRDSHLLLETALPELTRYSSTAKTLALRAVKIAMKIIAGREVPPNPGFVTPIFVRGATLGPCRSTLPNR
jgi:DNA-binding LacI/PurR family transcriptional regulator/biotin operon repressor